jgi:hypothetical protein
MSPEQQIYHKFLRTKADYSWDELTIPFKNFTQDVAVMLRDIEIFNLATTYGIECDIFIHPGHYLTQSPLAFVFQKDFALKEIIDHQLLKLMQSGVLKRLAKKHIKSISQDCQTPVRELSFRATFVSFAILAGGIITAIFILVIEKKRSKHCKKA